MRIRDRDSFHEEPVNLINFIDTLFFLVMFFLVATQFRAEERDVGVQLPALTSSQPLSAAPQQLVINIREDGAAVVGTRVYRQQELESLLADVAQHDARREVLIRADQRSLHKYFADVAAMCRRAGIAEAKIGYVLEEPR